MKYVVMFVFLLATTALFAENDGAQTNIDETKDVGKERSSKKESASSTNETIVFDRILLPVATNVISKSMANDIIGDAAKIAEAQAGRADERALVQCCAEQRALDPLLKKLNPVLSESKPKINLGQGFQHLVITIITTVATDQNEMKTISVFLRDGEVVDRFRNATEYSMIGVVISTNNIYAGAPLMHYTVRGKDIPVIDSKDYWWKYMSAAFKAIKLAGEPLAAQEDDKKSVEAIFLYVEKIHLKNRDTVLSTTAILYPESAANKINTDDAALKLAIANKIESLKQAASNLVSNSADAALAEFAKAKEFQALADALKENRGAMVESNNPESLSRVSASIQNRTTEHFNFGLAYVVKDNDQLTYDKDNGIVTAREESKTPAFLTVNYFPGGVEKRIKDAELDKSLPAPLWTPFHLMAGFRTDITDRFEPMMGAGVGIRVLEASLNVWAGVSLQKTQKLKSGIDEGAAAPSGGLTDDGYDVPLLWGISVSWKP